MDILKAISRAALSKFGCRSRLPWADLSAGEICYTPFAIFFYSA